jgi:hypothetical protein
MLYFDNQPHGHYGTIRQQIWAFLHFPLHLAIVGVVEGAQQMAAARYVSYNIYKLNNYVLDLCYNQNLSGSKLADKLVDLFFNTFKLDSKPETLMYLFLPDPGIAETVRNLRNSTNVGICSKANVKSFQPNEYDTWPVELVDWTRNMAEVSSPVQTHFPLLLPRVQTPPGCQSNPEMGLRHPVGGWYQGVM